MCTEGEKLIFCSCEGEIDKSQPNWRLMRYIQTIPSELRGKILMPSKSLDSGFSEALVLQQLNEGNIFDFDYSPQEKDWLRIDAGGSSSKYLSFYFKADKWHPGRSDDPFRDKYDCIASGKLEKTNHRTGDAGAK